jgi:hypothetical protein
MARASYPNFLDISKTLLELSLRIANLKKTFVIQSANKKVIDLKD